MSRLINCGRFNCDPAFFSRDGADHVGLDLYVRCRKCNREGPYVECERVTPALKDIVAEAWKDDLRTLSQGGKK